MEKAVQIMYEKWLNSDFIEENDKKELENIKGNDAEITERFYQSLEFGTGGLRGIRGVGTNRINKYTIRLATQGLANYMLKAMPQGASIAISHDSRIGSREYAVNTGLVMAANGIKVFIFESLRPTPTLSYAVRELGCLAGVMVTASHNPKEYNGYKVYWTDGAQVADPHDTLIIKEVNKIEDLSQIKLMSEEEAFAKGLMHVISKDLDARFMAEVLRQQVKPGIVKTVKNFKIVFTPLCGCGIEGVPEALKTIGVENLYLVKEQATPDGNFPTLDYPNPEDPRVFKLGMKLAEEKGAKYIIATDPDCDRVGTAVRGKNGKWYFPNGNQIGILLTYYIISNMSVPKNGVVVSTIVSTPMLDALCKEYGVEAMRTLTGFKYIGEKIKLFKEANDSHTYLFGFEESYGYLKGTHARDKDAVGAAMLVTEMFAYFDSIGSSVEEELEKLYTRFGFYQEGIVAISMEGKAGIERIGRIVNHFRDNMPTDIAGIKVDVARDFKTHVEKCLKTDISKVINLPASNVIQYVLEEGSVVTARPSGTEPKLKIYIAVKANSEKAAVEKVEVYKKAFESLALSVE
ncbi:MAG: phospho-sugar mutase [Fusobacteria bacterium]|nr:phospho-sugar mutase [Fusobacteriota bacterium]